MQGIQGLKAGYEKAIKDNGGAWPTPEQVAAAMHDVSFKGYGREVKMHRADGQGLEAQMFGVTRKSDKYPFKVLADITIIPAELVTPGVTDTSMEWIEKSLTPEVLKSDQIKVFAN
ncbi:hypothetical protein D9M69_669120 [compost metagenome]